MDALSDALRVLRLTGAVFVDAELTAPWCVASHSGNPTGPGLPSGPNIVFFHVFTEGRCKARLADGGDTLEPHATLGRIASDSGYDSGAAFNRAFKRAFGTTPAAWRRGGESRNSGAAAS